MSRDKNPWDVPEWLILSREAKLVRHLVGAGATALGKANYADKLGEYYTAFFCLSIGLERLSKLILVANYAIKNNGKMPDQKEIKTYGHNLTKLLDTVHSISQEENIKLSYKYPTSEICKKIIECLDSFADARKGRYANFTSLGDPYVQNENEPISKWWNDIAELILKEHCYGKPIEKRIKRNARNVDRLLSPFSCVQHFSETGESITDILSCSERTGETSIVQKYGRYYSLVIIRWLAEILSKLSEKATYEYKITTFFGLHEHFRDYTIEDEFLKTRKNWPLNQ